MEAKLLPGLFFPELSIYNIFFIQKGYRLLTFNFFFYANQVNFYLPALQFAEWN